MALNHLPPQDANYTNRTIEQLIALEKNPFDELAGKIQLWMSAILAVAICAENFLTFYIMWTCHTLHTIQNKYITSLAVADFVVGASLLELYLAKIFGWDCQLMIASLHATLGVSMLTMLAIAIDRYLFIVKPFIHMTWITHRTTNATIFTHWFIGLAYGFLPTYIYGIGREKTCHPFFTLHHDILTESHSCHFLINVSITGVLYGLIAKMAKQKNDQRRKAVTNLVRTLDKSSSSSNNNNNNDTSQKTRQHFFIKRLFNRKKKTSKENNNIICPNSKEFVPSKEDNNISFINITSLWRKYEITSSVVCPVDGVPKRQGVQMASHDDIHAEIISDHTVLTPAPKNGCIEPPKEVSQDASESYCTEQEDVNEETSQTPTSLHPQLDTKVDNLKTSKNSTTEQRSVSGGDSNSSTPPTTTTITTISLQRHAHSSHNFRWMRQMVMVYGLFVVCWTPSIVSTFLHLHAHTPQDPIFYLSWLGVANSSVNFYVYAFMNTQFRKALKRKFKGRCSSCRH